MDITLEWQGVTGIIKIIILFSIPFVVGLIIGRKSKK